MKIKKGDIVKVLYGKDAGKQGKVVAVDMKKSKVVVEGVNIFKKHVKGDGRTKTSEILTIVKPMDVSKVMLICNNCGKATRVGVKREEGKVSRVCKKCNKVIEVVKEVEKKEEPKKSTKKETVKKTTKKSSTTKKKVVKKKESKE
ncbi:MAG: 50S ribosomal protein L24 [Candidatus Dojkabacteria bacterium]|jgi:large subunit ribosomal protein L24|nr:50S ribosomal protein L24 [Candidatus Dojkabacteria bacterium]